MLSVKFYNVAQGSDEWYRLRIGRPTSSQFHRIVTPKGEPSKQAMAYLYRLVAERLLNETLDDDIGFVSYVRDGKEREPQAVQLFNFTNEVQLEPGGFITTDDGRLGASPDRVLKGMKEGVEVKCPAPQTQIKYLLDGPGDDYRAQVQGHLLVADAFQAVHFYTFHPQMPPFHKVTLPDRHYQVALRSALSAFCDALDIMHERAKSLGAYAVTRRAVTPAELAYGDVPIKIVNPEDNLGDAPA
jgi:YqaJ-like viral recombinase domain